MIQLTLDQHGGLQVARQEQPEPESQYCGGWRYAVPTDEAIEHALGVLCITPAARARFARPGPIDPDDPDESDWPLDAPFDDD